MPRVLLKYSHMEEVERITHDTLKRLSLVDKDPDEFSLDTVKVFRNDAIKAGFRLG